MPAFSYIRQPQPFLRSPSPDNSTTSDSVGGGHAVNSKAREESLLAEIEEIRNMGSSIPEDEANAMIAVRETELANMKKNCKTKPKSKTVDLLNKRLASVESKYKEDVDSLQIKLNEAKNALQECKSLTMKQKHFVEEKETQIAQLESKIIVLNDEIGHLKVKIVDQRKQIKVGKSKGKNIQQLEELAMDQEKFIEKLSNDIEVLEKERSSFNSRLAFANVSKNKLKNSNIELTQQLKDALKIETSLNLKLTERDKIIQSLKGEIAEAQSNAMTGEDPYASHQYDLIPQISSKELEQLQKIDVKTTSKIIDARVGQLSESCALLEQREQISQQIALNEVTKLKTVIRLLKKEINQVSNMEVEKEKLLLELNELQKNHKYDQEANAASVRAIQRVMKELSENKDSEISKLKEEIKKLTFANETLEKKIQNLKSRTTGLKNEKIQTDTSTVPTLVGIAASGVAASLTKKDNYADKNFEIDQLENEIEHLHEENETLRIAIRDLKSTQRNEIQSNDALREANIEIEELDTEIELLQRENENLRSKFDDLESSKLNASTGAGLSFYEHEIEEMTKNVESLQTENERLKERLRKSDCSDYDEKFLNICASPTAENSKDEVLLEKVQYLENENENLKGQLDQVLTDSFEGQNEKFTYTNSEFEVLHQKTESVANENEALKDQIKNLIASSYSSSDSPDKDSVKEVFSVNINASSKEIETGQAEKDTESVKSGNDTLKQEMKSWKLKEKRNKIKTEKLFDNDSFLDNCGSEQEDFVCDNDSATTDFASEQIDEIINLKKALHESTEREIEFTREINRLNELMKTQYSRQSDSLIVSQDESTMFSFLNETDNTNERVSKDREEEVNTSVPVVSPCKENRLCGQLHNHSQETKNMDEMSILKNGINMRDVELERSNKLVEELQTLLDTEQSNSVHEKEAILDVLQTKNNALENAKKIIASLQQARSDSLQMLKSDLSKKQEEIDSLQNASEEEKKRSVTLQEEIISLKKHISEEYMVKSNEFVGERSKDKIAATLTQISHAIQNPFFACIDTGSNSNPMNPMDDEKIQSYKASVLLDENGFPIGDRKIKSNESDYLINSQKNQDFEEEIQYLDSALEESNDIIKELEIKNLELSESMEKLLDEKKQEIGTMENRMILLEKKVKSLTEELKLAKASSFVRSSKTVTQLECEALNECPHIDLEKLQNQLDAALTDNEATKNALILTEESLRNAKMIISSLEKSNRRILDDFKTKLQRSSDNLSNLANDSAEKEQSMASIQNDLKELRVKKEKEIKSLEAKIRKLREVASKNEKKIFEQDHEIRHLNSELKKKKEKIYDESSCTDDSKSAVSVRSDGKKVRRVKRSEKRKKKLSIGSAGSSPIATSRSPSSTMVPRSPIKLRKSKIMNADQENEEFEIVTSTSMLLADDDSDASYDEKKLMKQYMERNNIASFVDHDENVGEI